VSETGPTTQTANAVVIEERADSVLTLRLNRPEKLNALNPDLARALLQSLLRASEDKTVSTIVITGAGRGFCAGGDVGFIRDTRTRRASHEFESLLTVGKEICVAIAVMPKLVIAAVNGPAAGGGMSLALACDLRIASDQATFTQAFGRLGLYPDLGATFFLPRLIGLSRASELFYTAEQISAQEAQRIGIVWSVFPQATFEQETQKVAQRVAAGPPIAYRDVKRTMLGVTRQELTDAIDEENRRQVHCFLSEDCAEGLAAFFEKRPPKFRGH